MNFLSIDCSTNIGSLFVKAKNKTFSKILQSDKSSNDLLMKQILDFFRENELNFDDIKEIFVNMGPGNFSGLRGSISTAKGICLSKNLDLFGYNTFIWSCAKFLKKQHTIFSVIIFRKKYFLKSFDTRLNKESKIEQISAEEILKNYNKDFIVIPNNIKKYFDEKILKLSNVNFVDLDHNELEFLKFNDLLVKDLIKPLYLG